MTMEFPEDIEIDEDIDLSRIFSPNLKLLCLKYKSIFAGTHENVDDIHFFDKYKRFFFTFTDSICNIYGDSEHCTHEEIVNTKGDFAFSAPILRAIYVLKGYRKKGLQQELIEDIKSVCEETAEPVVAIADPYIINKSRYENCIYKAWYKFCVDGYSRPSKERWLPQVKAQCKRFKELGFQNFIFPESEITIPPQHFIYVPTTALPATNLAIRTLQADPSKFSLDLLNDFDINNIPNT